MTTEFSMLDVTEAIEACPALVDFRLVCYELENDLATVFSMGHFFRIVVSVEDLMWVLEYWRYNGVYGGLPVDAPITLVSMKHLVRLAGVIEAIAMSDDMNTLPSDIRALTPQAETVPMALIIEQDHIDNLDLIAALRMQIGVLEVKLAGMTIDRDLQYEITVSSDRELARLNELLSVPSKAKKRKAKLSNQEKLALLWLKLPDTAESLWGINTFGNNKGLIAHTDWSDLWFSTFEHARAYLTIWAQDGLRPALSNLRIGMKPMVYHDEK